MELFEAVRRRRMVRSFSSDPVDPDLVDQLFGNALRAPSAGNTRGVSWLVLEGPETMRYWEHTTTAQWRRSSRRFAGLSRAPVVALSMCAPPAYLQRYGEPDKVESGLGPPPSGGGEAAWPVPYWFGDAAFSTMLVLLGVTQAGLAGAFQGNFRGEEALLSSLGVPSGWRLFGTVLIGHPDGHDHASASLSRSSDPAAGTLYRSRWGQRQRAATP